MIGDETFKSVWHLPLKEQGDWLEHCWELQQGIIVNKLSTNKTEQQQENVLIFLDKVRCKPVITNVFI